MKFEKTETQKAFDYVANLIQENIRIINSDSQSPNGIDCIRNGWGKRYIAFEDVYKLLDSRFKQHRYK